MGTGIYITSSEGHSGKSAVVLGILDTLRRRAGRVGVFRPIVAGGESRDPVLELLVEHGDPGLGLDYDDCRGVSYEDVHEDPDGAMSTILARYRRVADRCDAVVVVGSDFTDVGNPAELDYNARIAANLGAKILLVMTGRDPDTLEARTPGGIARAVESTLPELAASHAELLAVIVNRAEEGSLAEIRVAVRRALEGSPDPRVHGVPVWALPESPLLAAPSLGQLMRAVDGTLLRGEQAQLQREVMGFVVAAMAMEHVLDRLIEGGVVIVPSDRSETLVAILMAQTAETFPSLAGIIVNGPFEFPPAIERLMSGLPATPPMIRTRYGTFRTAQRAIATRGTLTSASRRKHDHAIANFERHVASDDIVALLEVPPSDVITPLLFEYRLLDRARAGRKRIVLPEGADERVLEAAGTILAREVADITILGDAAEIRARASSLGVELSAAQLLSTEDPELLDRFAAEYARIRAHKGVTVEEARERMRDVSYFGTMMVHLGLADGMVSGAMHTTAHTIKPGFEIVKTSPGTSIVSSVFLMALADRVLVYGDCAVNPDPDASQLADIAISSAETAARFGIEPRVAMLSYSTGESGAGADVDKVREATAIVRQRRPDLPVEGPIQYDAASDAAVAAKKMPDSRVAGRATVFVFPDLNTGNNTYKAVQRSAGAVAIGPVLQGIAKPINDLSRGATVPDIVNTVAITAIQAQGEPGEAGA
ncbi:MAG: phosphate acetyltransferase [Pseudoclavibacter sp.]|nr:phosphate acetyltransferase [Pseudoclavibacter sp.]